MDSPIERVLRTTFRWQSRHIMRLSDDVPDGIPAPPSGPASLYVHVPFCEVLCSFCTFHRVRLRESAARSYFTALRDELRMYHRAGFTFTGMYVGGGTPTCVPAELAETVALARELFAVTDISVETNPMDLRPPVVAELVRVGVSRLSVGVQSFDDRLLRAMDRHDRYGSSAQIVDRLQSIAGVFPTLNVDLMYNLPLQDDASVERDLETVLGLPVDQVSFYPLMTTRAGGEAIRAAMGGPIPGKVREHYERYLARLRPAFQPQSCWCFARSTSAADEYLVEADHYVGVGSGAFSYLDGTLYATTFSLDHYADLVHTGRTGITRRRAFSRSDQMKNTFLTRLFGLELEKTWVEQRWGGDFEAELGFAIGAMKALRALTEDDAAWRLTDRGMYYWVLMMAEFFESVNRFREAMREHVRAELENHVPDGSESPPALAASIGRP